MAPLVRALSKSRYLSGGQCGKRLWIETQRPELLPPVDAATQAIFDQGHEVGELARSLFPGGVEVGRAQLDWASAIAATRTALPSRLPLYEPAFEHERAACRVDLLVPVADGAWDLYEVKSSSSVKDVNIEDVAFQTWVARGAGIRLRRSHLIHLDSGYERQGELDLGRLFTRVDLTETIALILPNLAARVASLQAVQTQSRAPEVTIGPHCTDPYRCPLIAHCWSGVPQESVFTLVHAGATKWRLFERGIRELVTIPDDFELTARQKIQVAAARSGEPHVALPDLRYFLSTLTYPLCYLDLETFASAVPPYPATRPYQQIPFQFSLHVVDHPGAAARASAFLAPDAGDPRRELVAALRREMGELEGSGSIVAYNAGFERARLAEAATLFPEHEAWAERLRHRFVDLLVPFRKFVYYHPAQLGSASLKSVLPILGARGYGHLEIQAGDLAAREFVRSNLAATAPEERARIRAALLDYCGRDTEGMIEIVAALERLAAE